jgi:hypothetical protein
MTNGLKALSFNATKSFVPSGHCGTIDDSLLALGGTSTNCVELSTANGVNMSAYVSLDKTKVTVWVSGALGLIHVTLTSKNINCLW